MRNTRKSRKSYFEFWEKKIRETDSILVGNFEKEKITKESVIIYIGIMDEKKEVFRSGWSCYEDIDSALGFLQHVFLPTAYYTWVDRESQGIFVPMSSFKTLKREVLKYIDDQYIEKLRLEALGLEKGYYYLNHLWNYGEEEKKHKIKEFCEDFNNQWNKELSKGLFVKVIDNCQEIPNEILEKEEFLEVIEEEMDMSFLEFSEMCKNAYTEPLINKNFISLLNSKLPIWF